MERPTYFYQAVGSSKHPKIKALEEKFGVQGYTYYFITIEILSAYNGSIALEDFNREVEESNFKGCTDKFHEVIEYGFGLDLFDKDLYRNEKVLEAKDHEGIFLYANEYEKEID